MGNGQHHPVLAKVWLRILALLNPVQSRMKVVLSVRVGVSGVLCHLELSTVTTRHDDDWWFCSVLSSGLIDGFFKLHVREIYPVLICLIDVK